MKFYSALAVSQSTVHNWADADWTDSARAPGK